MTSIRILLLLLFATNLGFAHLPSQEETIENRSRLNSLIDSQSQPQCFSIPEGGFVYYFHPDVEKWLAKPLNIETIREIRKSLAPHLKIPLTNEGFTAAATRTSEDEPDITNYSAVWVRDCCWSYFGLKTYDVSASKQLILSLLDFYSTENQRDRFLSVIRNPSIADPSLNPKAHMSVPLIRFSSRTLSHHQVDGKAQEWNHLQFDSHGLFLLALADAISTHILQPSDLKPQHLATIALFPAFFTAVNYAAKKDAGPWEEELLYNASSAGFVASGLKRISAVIEDLHLKQELAIALKSIKDSSLIHKIKTALLPENIEQLYQKGLKRVEANLKLGGEAPENLNRRADVALLFLCLLDYTPYHNQEEKIREILNINLSLIGPYGIYRYHKDPYQAANYWVTYSSPSPITGINTPELIFIQRFHKGYSPNKQPFDAQWFFDSNFAQIYYHLASLQSEPIARTYYIRQGDIHLKRALGQFTGPDAIAANGEKLKPWQLPESINTVMESSGIHPLPSPICPLNWAKAVFLMALSEAEKTHSVPLP